MESRAASSVAMAVSTWVLLTTVLAAVGAFWMHWRQKNKRLFELAALLPGPPTVPLFGNALIFVNTPILEAVTWLMRKYGDYVRIWMGLELTVYIANPTDVRFLLMSNKMNQKGKNYKVLEKILGPGIITGGPTWRNHRKLCNPTYNRRLGPHFCDIFNQEAECLIKDLEKKDPHITFNIFKNVIWATTYSVCRTLMGLTKEEALRVKHIAEVVEFTEDMYTLAYDQISKWYLWIPIIFKALGYKKRRDHYRDTTAEMARDIIKMRRKDLTARHITENDLIDEQGVVEGFGVIDRFILSDEFTETEKYNETYTLFTASQEACGKLTSFVLLFFAHLPEWQDKVYSELIQVIGEDRPLTEDDLKNLVYLEAVFREALRYMPIAACIEREVHEDVTLESAKITIPAGTPVILPIHAMHRDPKYWDQPDRVMPERFLTEGNKKKEPEAYLPFSLGVMDCVGRAFAYSLVKIVAARVVRNFKLSAEGRIEDLELDVAISTKFKHGCNLRVQRRTPAA